MKQINEIDLNSYRDRVYQNAVNHGWHEEKKSKGHWLCMVISELMEAVEADRNRKYAYESVINAEIRPLLETKNDAWKSHFEEYIKNTVEDELADVCIRLLDFAGVIDFDLNDLDYDGSDTEDYSELTFTESMFCIIRCMYEFSSNHTDSMLNEIFAFCRSRNIDIFWFIEQKMKYNESRPFKHGGKKY